MIVFFSTEATNENVAPGKSNGLNDSVVYVSTQYVSGPMLPQKEEQNGESGADANASVHLAKGKPNPYNFLGMFN